MNLKRIQQIKELTPLAIDAVLSEATTELPTVRRLANGAYENASAGNARVIASTNRRRAANKKVLEKLKAKDPNCVCDPGKAVELIKAVAAAVELVYQIFKNRGEIVIGRYVGT